MSQRSVASIEDELATDDKGECVILIEETNEDEKEQSKIDDVKQPEDEAAAASPQIDAESYDVEAPSIESTDERVELDAEKLKQILEIGTAAFPDIVERPIELKLPIEYSSSGLSSECNNLTCSVNVTLLLLSAKHSY
jgi:hypothetical protein